MSQLKVHIDEYCERKDDEGIKMEKQPKGLLLINSENHLTPEERHKVGVEQIRQAERNDSIIVLTPDLLDLYVDFRSKKITSEEILKIFTKETGLYKREK